MKNKERKMETFVRFAAIALFLVFLAGCSSAPVASPAAAPTPKTATAATTRATKDGTYHVTCITDGEGYYVQGVLTIVGGKIASAEWAIYDKNRNDKLFDKDYETVFAGQDMYIQQCRDNLKGMAGYSSKLIETQDAGGVDAVSGATWALS
jgi:major membrane immunogen (membrane-anchored lipoprotein)